MNRAETGWKAIPRKVRGSLVVIRLVSSMHTVYIVCMHSQVAISCDHCMQHVRTGI